MKNKDTTSKRMSRGLKVVGSKLKEGYKKVCESDFVKNVQVENENTNYPITPQELQKQEISKKKGKDPFATDLSDMNKTDL